MSTEANPSAATPAREEQPVLAPLPERIEREETEIQSILERSTQAALAHTPHLDEKAIERILTSRAQLIKRVRAIAVGMTEPQHWTLYRARDGSVTAVPAAPACLVMRRWAGISIRNHRSMNGEAGIATVSTVPNEKGDPVTLVEMMADGFWGQANEPDVESVYANLRSDDDFTGRTKRAASHGGARPEDLLLSLRTTLDSKVVRAMLGLTKVTGDELVRHGIGLEKCTKGSGFGTSSERTAGAVAEEGVRGAAEQLWKEILKRTGGKVEEAKRALKDITSYPAFKGRDGTAVPAFAGIDSWERFTKAEKVLKAVEKLKKHEVFGDQPRTGE